MNEQTSKSLKITLGIFLFVALGTLVFVLLSQKKAEAPVVTMVPPVVKVDQSKTDQVKPAEAVTETPVFKLVPADTFLSAEEIQKQLKAIQDKVNAGTLSVEEAKKERDSIIVRMQPPTPPATQK